MVLYVAFRRFDYSPDRVLPEEGTPMITIPIEDLVDGVRQVDFDSTPDDLALPRDDGRFESPIHISAKLTKMGNHLVIRGEISVEVTTECSRCLTIFKKPVITQIDVLFERTDHLSIDSDDVDESDDLVFLDIDAKEIDIGSRVVEAIRLAMPLKPLCNEVCKGLCSICGTDLNKGSCKCKVESEDPRWQSLKGIYQ